MADYKAVSMNLMHEDIKTTDQIYAPILSNEVRQRISNLSKSSKFQMDNEIAELLCGLSDTQLSKAILFAAKRLVNL